jgi:ribosome recycling factor
VRRHAKDELEHLEREGELSEDELKRVEKELQHLTDRFTHEIDEMSSHKEHELLEV